MAVTVIAQRMNFVVIPHGCWLVALLTRRHRAAIARLWPNYCLFLALFLLYQYLLCLGIPPALCIGERAASTEGAGVPGGGCGIPGMVGGLAPGTSGVCFLPASYRERFEAIREVRGGTQGAAGPSSGATQESVSPAR